MENTSMCVGRTPGSSHYMCVKLSDVKEIVSKEYYDIARVIKI